MTTHSGFDRIQKILEFIQLKPTLPQLLIHLSEHVCPRGEIAGVAAFELQDNGEVVSNGFYGFNELNHFDYNFNITDDRPGAEALRAMKIIIESREKVKEKFKDFKDNFHPTHYRTAVALPVSARELFVCALNSGLDDFPAMYEYFACINSILGYWVNISTMSAISRNVKPQEESKELTERQNLILELIRDGKTNASIALSLGYSESLIRQESIIIYRKLNISGRRDLNNHSELETGR